MKSFTITKNDSAQRLDKFLIKTFKAMPKSLVYKSLRKKRIKVNGARITTPEYILKEGDFLEAYINDEFFEKKDGADAFLLLSSAPLDVLYEDENIIAVNKPQGLSVHADETETPDTLINRILKYLYDKREYVPDKDITFTPALAHRIDRNTEGIVLAAKNAEALRILCQKIKDRELKKTYLCIVCGHLPKESDTLRAYHRKDEKMKLAHVTDTHVPGCKEMVTEYKVLKQYKNHDLAEVNLITGRTHQIRAHMAHIGHPLLGDGKYGKLRKDALLTRQALIAFKVRFAFESDAGILSYLNKKEIAIQSPAKTWETIENKL